MSVADLATLLAAVKPRQRTSQYVVLSALFALGAHTRPVTAKAVTELLRLHLRKKAPSNVSASLRKYSRYVSPREKGPPLRWALTDQGLARLADLSGVDLGFDSSEGAFASDVGIVCALEQPELDAVVEAVGDGEWRDVDDPQHVHLYREATLRTVEGAALRVIATTATSMGLTAAAIATTQLIMKFRPRLVVMVGIAAGTKDHKKQFGDVLVADPSVDYNSGKVVRVGGIREFQPDPYPIGLHPRLRSVLHRYGGANAVFEQIRGRWSGAVPGEANRLHLGPLGAADQVIDDESRISEIQKNWRKLIGVEMETYGVYRATHEAPEPKPRVVSFKAVCDFASNKGDDWQEFAAFVAAQFTIEFLRREWAKLWPVQVSQ
jgi:nucleoside phosphorylase